MAWTKVGETSFELTSGAGTETNNLPGTPAEGDIVLVLRGCDDNLDDVSIVTAGYTSLVTLEPTAGHPGRGVEYKVLGATPDTNIEINQNSVRNQIVIVQIWRGVDTTTPIDATANEAKGTVGDSNGIPDPPSHTTATNGALRIIMGILDDDQDASNTTYPTGYSNGISAETSVGGNSDATIMMASKEEATAGADDPGEFGGLGSDSWYAIHFSLRPAEVGGSFPANSLQMMGLGI